MSKKYLFLFIIGLLSINFFLIGNFEKFINNKPWLLTTDPMISRFFSPSGGRKLLADRIWLLSRYIDEINKKNSPQAEQIELVYKNITILDSNLRIANIYGATYLASNLEQPKLAIKLLQISRLIGGDNFENLFTELIFRIVYLKDNNFDDLKNLAEQVAKMNDEVKKVGKIDVRGWAEEIIIYLQNEEINKKIKTEDRQWLESFKEKRL